MGLYSAMDSTNLLYNIAMSPREIAFKAREEQQAMDVEQKHRKSVVNKVLEQ